MFTDFYHSFYYVLLLFGALTSLVFIYRIDFSFKLLAVLIILTLTSELTAKYISFSLRKDNNIVYHFFTLVEYVFYSLIYASFFNSKKWNYILAAFVIFLMTAELVNALYFQPLSSSNTNTTILESVLLIFLSLSLFNKIREDSNYKNILKESIFWFNCAVLIYYPFNILIWGFHSIKVYQLKNPPILIYYINLLFSGLLYLVFSLSIIINFIHRNKLKKTI